MLAPGVLAAEERRQGSVDGVYEPEEQWQQECVDGSQKPPGRTSASEVVDARLLFSEELQAGFWVSRCQSEDLEHV